MSTGETAIEKGDWVSWVQSGLLCIGQVVAIHPEATYPWGSRVVTTGGCTTQEAILEIRREAGR